MINLRIFFFITFALFFSCRSNSQQLNKTVIPVSNQTPNPNANMLTLDHFQQEMLNRVNQLRASGCMCGGQKMQPVGSLRWNGLLEQAAIRHAEDMKDHNFFNHKGSDGTEVDKRATEAGYNWSNIGENIAFGYPDMPQVIKGWIKSPGHCKQMMNPAFKEMGAAQDDTYWVQVFGKQLR